MGLPVSTGKTSKGIDIVSRELADGVSPKEIGFLSFTKVASHVARDRAIEHFPECDARDFSHFTNIHSLCYRMLGLGRENVFTAKALRMFGKQYHYAYTNDSEVSMDQNLQEIPVVTLADYYEQFVSWWKNSLIKDFSSAVHIFSRRVDAPVGFSYDGLETYVKRREAYKQDNKLYDFADMLYESYAQGLCPPIQTLIADECQDNFPLIWLVLRQWIKEVKRVYLFGDPYQCIYQFAGAQPELLIDFPADETHTLQQSWRCPQKVHDLSRKVVDQFKVRYENDDYSPRDSNGRISTHINFELTEEPTFWLFRTRWLLSMTYDYLYMRGVPFATRRGPATIFNKKLDGKRKAVYGLSKLHDRKGITLLELANLTQYIPSKFGRVVLIERGAKKRIREESSLNPFEAVQWADLLHLGFKPDLLQDIAEDKGIEVLRNFSREEKSYIRRVLKKYGTAVLADKPNLELSTYHGIKGEEAKRVIISRDMTRRPYANYVNGNDEEHRLFYVGITRSFDEVVVLPPSQTMCYRLQVD